MLCSASYVRWQRGTACIRPPHAAAAERRSCSNQSIYPARRVHSSKSAAAGTAYRAGRARNRRYNVDIGIGRLTAWQALPVVGAVAVNNGCV